MQEVAYGTQLESRRSMAHARLARMLAGSHLPEGAPIEESLRIAHHWAAAGEWAAAGAWALNATRWIAPRDLQETVRQFRAARDYYERAPNPAEHHKGRIAARSGIIRMAQFAGVPAAEVDQAYTEARQLADECGDVACAIELLLSYGGEHLHRGDAQRAADHSARAVDLALANRAGDMVQRFRLAVLLSHHAAGLPLLGLERVDRATGTGWRTEAISEDNYMSRGFYGLMQVWLGQYAEAEKNLREALAYAVRDDRSASWMHANMAEFALFAGRPAEALHQAQLAMQMAESYGSPFFITVASRSLAFALCANGRAQEGLAALERIAHQVLPGAPAHQFEAGFHSAMARAYRELDRFAEAERAARAGIDSAQRSQSRLYELAAQLDLLELPISQIKRVDAEVALARATELLAMTGGRGLAPTLEAARQRWA